MANQSSRAGGSKSLHVDHNGNLVLTEEQRIRWGLMPGSEIQVRETAIPMTRLRRSVSSRFRVPIARIDLPPLSARKEDIPLLVEHFIHKFNLIKNRSIRGADPQLLDFLMGYPFPGNIRELENFIEYAFITCKGDMIGLEHLPKEVCDVAVRKVLPEPVVSAPPDCREAAEIRVGLEKHGGHRIRAAKALGLSRATLWRKIRK